MFNFTYLLLFSVFTVCSGFLSCFLGLVHISTVIVVISFHLGLVRAWPCLRVLGPFSSFRVSTCVLRPISSTVC